MITHHSGLLAKHCRLDPAVTLQPQRQSLERNPVEAFPAFDLKFPDMSGTSETRQAVTKLAHSTRMMLHKRVTGAPKELSALRREVHAPDSATAQEVINAILQRN